MATDFALAALLTSASACSLAVVDAWPKLAKLFSVREQRVFEFIETAPPSRLQTPCQIQNIANQE